MICRASGRCGGCQYMNVPYEEQLKNKREAVRALFPGKNVDQVLGMKDPYHYRHKVYAAFHKSRSGRVAAGMYAENTHEVISEPDCLIQHETANRIIKAITDTANEMHIDPYDEDQHSGILRHAYIRISHATGKAMVVLVISTKDMPGGRKFVSSLIHQCPQIETVLVSQNSRKTSMVLGEKTRVVYGSGCITDTIGDLKFRISPQSFYQVNPVQTERLYETAISLAKLNENSVVLDACCGIGTISLLAAEKAKQVIGVEVNPQAIHDAIGNARFNHIRNAQFACADATEFMRQNPVFCNTVFLDPPRAGLTREFMQSLRKMNPETIVYISCNPETQARDIRELRGAYSIRKIVPVDQFPFTPHVETIVLLQRQNS